MRRMDRPDINLAAPPRLMRAWARVDVGQAQITRQRLIRGKAAGYEPLPRFRSRAYVAVGAVKGACGTSSCVGCKPLTAPPTTHRRFSMPVVGSVALIGGLGVIRERLAGRASGTTTQTHPPGTPHRYTA